MCPGQIYHGGTDLSGIQPYDRLILDRRMRFVGDAAAIVAGETEKAVDRALKIIKVKYKVLEPVLDFHKAKDNAVCIHGGQLGVTFSCGSRQ